MNPAIVLGPATDTDISSSHEVIKLMAKGAYPAAPKVGFPISDVRDVAATHVLAMTKPEAAGKRFLTANGFLRLIEVGRLVADALPDLKGKVPRRELPDLLVRAVAIIDRRLKAVIPDLGHPRPDLERPGAARAGAVVPLRARGRQIGGAEPARARGHLTRDWAKEPEAGRFATAFREARLAHAFAGHWRAV